MGENGVRIKVQCKDCSFEKFVDPDDDTKPANVVIEHGQRTGHTLSVTRIEED